MKTILAAIALLAASTAAHASPQYVVTVFDYGAKTAHVVKEYWELPDYLDCVDEAQSSGEGDWASCVPVTGEAEAFILEDEPCDCILDEDD